MTKRQQLTYGIIAGSVLILVYLVLSFTFKCLSHPQYIALKITIALGAAAFAAAIPGAINVQYHKSITASGAIAIFVIIFLINPPAMQGLETGCPDEEVTVKVVVFVDDLPFEFAKVIIVDLEKEGYTNSYGSFPFQMKSPTTDSLFIRIKSESMLIDVVRKVKPINNKIEFKLKSRVTKNIVTRPLITETVKPQQSGKKVKSIKIVPADTVKVLTPSNVDTPIKVPPLPTIINYCVSCRATDSKGTIVNEKNKCNVDSLYIVNYILGFTNASKEQGRQASCKWENASILSLEELKKVELARGLVNFMQTYAGSCFNSARIKHWGGQRKGFTVLSQYSYFQIDQMLEALRHHKVLETGTCSTAELYSFSEQSPDIRDFLN
jgi:hypothetical protein